MEEVQRLHKDTNFGWVAMLQNYLAAKAQARRERAMAIWCDGASPARSSPRPDDMYRFMLMGIGMRR